MQNQSLHSSKTIAIQLVAGIVSLLSIPLIAMQFTEEVNWSLFDFMAAGTLLGIAGTLMVLTVRRNKLSPTGKRMALLAIFITFVVIWIELAVGIFNTPFAGN